MEEEEGVAGLGGGERGGEGRRVGGLVVRVKEEEGEAGWAGG